MERRQIRFEHRAIDDESSSRECRKLSLERHGLSAESHVVAVLVVGATGYQRGEGARERDARRSASTEDLGLALRVSGWTLHSRSSSNPGPGVRRSGHDLAP